MTLFKNTYRKVKNKKGKFKLTLKMVAVALKSMVRHIAVFQSYEIFTTAS
jgi:hypothetical protein